MMNLQPSRQSPLGSKKIQPIQLLVLDVDGTVTNSQHKVTEATISAIHRVRAAGIRVLLATGRRYRDVLPIASQLQIVEPLVTASGALVKQQSDHRTHFRAVFQPGVLENVLAIIISYGHEPVLYTDSYEQGFDFHCRKLLQDLTTSKKGHGFQEYLKCNQMLAKVTPNLHKEPPMEVFAGFVMGSQEDMHVLESVIRKTWSSEVSLHTIKSPRYSDFLCEIAPAKVTKWSAILRLANDWGIGPEAICAVGDDRNDTPMIRGAGLGIAMGNAVPEVRAVADHVVGRHDDNGLVDVANLLLATLS